MSLEPPAQPALYLGTCAWSFEEWHGVFYPPHLPAGERLAYYARFFNSVEIDSTFYAAPSAQTARHWLATSPPDFRFACKMPREITHQRRLQASRELVRDFCSSMAPLREKLKAILVQLPPYFSPRKDGKYLEPFLEDLPRDFRYAVEFRDPAWFQPKVVKLLEDHQVCWVWNDMTPPEVQEQGAFEFFPRTTDFLYVRLLGDAGTKYLPNGERKHRYDRLMWPRDASLENWAVRLQQMAEESREHLIYANNHFEGFSPATCKRLAAKFGQSLQLPTAEELRPAPVRSSGQMELQL